MPPSRASTSTSSSSSSGAKTNFRGVEQSLNIMKQVKSYFIVGMENVLEVATDMAEYGKGDDNNVRKLRNIMQSFVLMERDLDHVMDATSQILAEAAEIGETGSFESVLDEKIAELGQDRSESRLKEHVKCVELEQKIWDSQHPGAVLAGLPGAMPIIEGDIEMTQDTLTTRCPYTLQEMVEPMRNQICKHNYDKTGILQFIKLRGKKAICPVIGCGNKKPIIATDLEPNQELRRYIQRQKRHPTASTSSSSTSVSSSQSSGAQSSSSNAVIIHEG